MHSWVREPRVAGGKGMTYGRLFERHLDADGSPLAFADPPLYLSSARAQDRADWS
jgi:hypothetical protein